MTFLSCFLVKQDRNKKLLSKPELLMIPVKYVEVKDMLWLRVPEKVYIKKGCMPVALRELKDVMGKNKAFIVTDNQSYQDGRIVPVEKILDEMNIQHTAFFAINEDVSVCDAASGAKAAQLFEPDVIIAVGRSNVMNAAKLIRVLYEVPGADIADLSVRFGDIRKRDELFPRTNVKAALVAIPTSSGMGDEVTPYASASYGEKKYILADYEIMPEFVIIDSDYMINQTRQQIADSAKTAVEHLINAYEAENASEYTDGFVFKAMELIIKYLPSYIENGSDDPVGCEKIAEASAISGIAYANTNYVSTDENTVSDLAERIKKNVNEDKNAFNRYRDLGLGLGIVGNDDNETVALLIEKIRELVSLCG